MLVLELITGATAMRASTVVIALGIGLVISCVAGLSMAQDAAKSAPPAEQTTNSAQATKTNSPKKPMTREVCVAACKLGISQSGLSGDDAALFNECAGAGHCRSSIIFNQANEGRGLDDPTRGSVFEFLRGWWPS
jgi:hypothetical protein